MFFSNISNSCVTLPEGKMDYIRFGHGGNVLVMLPGVGDGLKTVRGMALPFAVLYRALAKDFTVYVFSRRRNLPPHMSTRQMAHELNEALDVLGLSGTAVVGVSQGGMIAQWLAIDHPDKVRSLVLAVTLARPNSTVRNVVRQWTKMAKLGDYKGILLDTAMRSYSGEYLHKALISYRLLGNLGKPKSFRRFLIQAESCVTHNAYAYLPRITCPTLVIGGTEDKIVTGDASGEIAAEIPGSRLKMYRGLGHGLYDESPDFLRQVIDHCRI
ncbi:MAG: alpha/beta hydrolase [Eubacteriales bacterium]|nr:alpha/beta hydrolase [Eubacteriales bacterium]